MKRAVERNMQRRPIKKSILWAEVQKDFLRIQDYIALMTDLRGARVPEVMQETRRMQVVAHRQSLPQEKRKQVLEAKKDRGRLMTAGSRAAVPPASIFHEHQPINAEQNCAVDNMCRTESKRLMKVGDDALKGTRSIWLRKLGNLGEAAIAKFKILMKVNVKTSRA